MIECESSICWFSLQMVATASLGHAEARSQEPHQGLRCEWQVPNDLGHHPLFPRTLDQKQNSLAWN